MNLIAMTGLGELCGTALRMLEIYHERMTPKTRRGEITTYEAYAPCPIVLLTSRKGRFVGRGAIWLLGGAGPMVSRCRGGMCGEAS